jgi:hypothetical protein
MNIVLNVVVIRQSGVRMSFKAHELSITRYRVETVIVA